MEIPIAKRNNPLLVHDYFMPGRAEIEPGSQEPYGRASGGVATGSEARSAANMDGGSFFGADGMTFADLLDVLNPLQHLPVIGGIYRAITADEISPGARLAGGALYGGPVGFMSSLINTVVEEATGKDVGGNVLAQLLPDLETDGGSLTAEATTEDGPAKLASVAPPPLASGDGAAANAATVALSANMQQGSMLANQAAPAPKSGLFQHARATTSNQGSPELSPAAFQALLSSVNGPPIQDNSKGLTAGAEALPAKNGTIRDAGLEIHRLLRDRANEQK